ncbi:carbamoyltransferase HypF [Nocardioides sp. YIM 152588]|uniref:carbamoyltransferase HypF n=1 Tax=Nocardioides sp. YIM 152588 TaxID=3158259 RepID=UPI0032E3D12F
MTAEATVPSAAARVRRRVEVRGLVQGVGFRPYVARLAAQAGVDGWCRNDATCVVIEVEGPPARVADFEARLPSGAPPLSRIREVGATDVAPQGAAGFAIVASREAGGERTLVAPDTAVCAECLAEMSDPGDRRYRHPFITCTACGPRLTITLDLPYDRPATTMAGFAMCAACAAEYADPRDRRYHAQPIACHDCGPRLTALAPDGRTVAAGTEPALAAAVAALRTGRIVAVKGIGGYHLACDAADAAAVAALRRRKGRPDQPFAVMARDLGVARLLVEGLAEPGGAAALVTGPERPIVLLPARADAPVAGGVAPGLDELGVMLPYAPLHHLLLADLPDGSPGAPPALVMTSGNASGEPLCHRDDEALERLGGLADLVLAHDRDIAVPVEDSVLAWPGDGAAPVPVRRSRGHAPLPVDLPGDPGTVLAAGAELKNTVALARDGRAFVSAHVGDLESYAGRATHARVADQLVRFHRSAPALVVADAHPGYASRAWARTYADEHAVPLLEVQHHHAHLASLAAEHGRLGEPLVGLVLDGTGYGCDATIWGGELLRLTDGGAGAERLGHLGAVRLPGGDEGVRNPVRVAALALLAAGETWDGTPVAGALTAAEAPFLDRVHRSGLGAVDTSSAGRLFDAVASLLGVRHRITYDAQAAIELEALARRWRRAARAEPDALPFPVVDGVLDPRPLIAALAAAVRAGVDRGALAWAFHDALARAGAEAASAALAAGPGADTVGLTGGVFVNRVLLERTRHHLARHGLRALTHARVPANDGGLSLGQIAVGVRRLAAPHPSDRPTR